MSGIKKAATRNRVQRHAGQREPAPRARAGWGLILAGVSYIIDLMYTKMFSNGVIL